MTKNLQQLLDEHNDQNYKAQYTFSEESRAKISEASKRRWQDPKYRARMAEVVRDGSSKETKEKISAAKKGKPAHNKGKGKRIMTPHGEFPSLTAVSIAAEVRPSTVYEWMKKYPEHYYYLDKKEV
jgi:hypothetical protein